EEARRDVQDRQRTHELLRHDVAVRVAERALLVEQLVRRVELGVLQVADTTGDAEATELTGVAQSDVPEVVLGDRGLQGEAGERRSLIKDVIGTTRVPSFVTTDGSCPGGTYGGAGTRQEAVVPAQDEAAHVERKVRRARRAHAGKVDEDEVVRRR